jgi:hypothetical protein
MQKLGKLKARLQEEGPIFVNITVLVTETVRFVWFYSQQVKYLNLMV